VPLIRPRVAEVRHDRGDAGGRRTAAGVGQSEQLDQVIVDRRRGRLYQEVLFAAHRLEQLHGDFAVREPADPACADLHVQLACNRRGQGRVGGSGQDPELSAHRARSTRFASACCAGVGAVRP
jgi:hypothetical protein